MRKLRYLYIELYGINIYYIRCSRTIYTKRVQWEFDTGAPDKPPSTRGTFEVYMKGDLPIGVVWLSDKADIGHLVHECLHCVHYFLEYKGLFLSNNSEEAYAYLIQYIFNKTKGILKRR